MSNAITTRRMTFQPINPGKYSRPASLPVGHPVQALQNNEDGWTLIANVDREGDYMAAVAPGDFVLQ